MYIMLIVAYSWNEKVIIVLKIEYDTHFKMDGV